MKKIIYCLFLIFFLTGCWDYRELNEYAIVTGMAIDEKDGKYEVSLLFANGKKEEESQGEVSLYTNEGASIYEAIKNISLSVPKEIYLSHLSVIIISENLAKKGVTPILDYLLREPESHQNFFILFSKDCKAKDILSIINPVSDYPSQNIIQNININQNIQGRITDSSFNKFISTLLKTGANPIANSIVLVGDKEKGSKKEEQENSVTNAYIKLDSLGIFKGDKLVDWATTDESIGINMLLGKVSKLYLEIPCDDNKTIITTESFKVKNNVSKNKIDVNIKTDGSIIETGCNLDLESLSIIKELEKKAEDKMYNYVYDAVNKAKKLGTDIFGYGNMIYKHYPKYYSGINNWNEQFKALDIDVKIDFSLEEKGALEQTIGELSK